LPIHKIATFENPKKPIMKRLLTTSCTNGAFNIATFIIRVTFGFLLFWNHGLSKMKGFSEMSGKFFDPFHIGGSTSLALVVFAEVFCAILVVLGLFTRLVAIVIVIEMLVAVLLFHKGQPLANFEMAVLYLAAFAGIVCLGPGKYSVDGAMGK
jgi:putative oxidoreductase